MYQRSGPLWSGCPRGTVLQQAGLLKHRSAEATWFSRPTISDALGELEDLLTGADGLDGETVIQSRPDRLIVRWSPSRIPDGHSMTRGRHPARLGSTSRSW